MAGLGKQRRSAGVDTAVMVRLGSHPTRVQPQGVNGNSGHADDVCERAWRAATLVRRGDSEQKAQANTTAACCGAALRRGSRAPGLSATAASQAWPGVHACGRRANAVAQGCGDRAYARKPTKDVSCMLFKAFKSTNQLAKPPNPSLLYLRGYIRLLKQAII